MTLRITIPKNVANIIHKLNSNGYEAYVVGGCVRDSVLNLTPADWDITTSARPEQVKALFSKTIDTGIKHGTVTVMFGKEGYEVTTYRVGGAFDAGLAPEVTFADHLEQDLAHRDFTINAMAYHPTEGLIDLFGGIEDLEHGVVRCIGTAVDRFIEDPLRMLRAIRFAAKLNYNVDEQTMEAIRSRYQTLESVSQERIQMELLKLLISDHPEKLLLAYDTGLTSVFLPEFDDMMKTPQNNPHHCYSVGEHTIHAVCAIEPNPVLRLTMLFHDIGKPATRTTDSRGIDHFHNHYQVGADMSQNILKRLKFDNNTIKLVRTLITYHDQRFSDSLHTGRRNLRRVISMVGATLFPYLLKVMQADISAQSEYHQEDKIQALAEAEVAYREIIKAGDCLSLKELKINGNDLKALGITNGRAIGSILNILLQMVIENPELNQFIYLEELAKKVYKELDS